MMLSLGRVLTVAVVAVVISLAAPVKADVSFVVDPGYDWVGYMNWFDADTAAYAGGSSWGIDALPAVFSGNTLELSPNTNVWEPGNSYWVKPDGTAAKSMEANLYIEDTSLIGQTVEFSGHVVDNTFAAGYDCQAFIKVLDPAQGWAVTASQFVQLTPGADFDLSLAIDNTPGLIPQFGFVTTGLCADPATVAALGSCVIATVPEPATLGLLAVGAFALIRRR